MPRNPTMDAPAQDGGFVRLEVAAQAGDWAVTRHVAIKRAGSTEWAKLDAMALRCEHWGITHVPSTLRACSGTRSALEAVLHGVDAAYPAGTTLDALRNDGGAAFGDLGGRRVVPKAGKGLKGSMLWFGPLPALWKWADKRKAVPRAA